ncbi:hypothetical protein NDU88_002792 [Pleurodeles waltl]|uniref:Uncharacterized protein n=1 Tax=Pleurodeles waltl TaxID=8319 RepID=A0AAV7LJS4_PLEWA|nr:hypothetical protein NDU88_002792 [Pleurodeles waltl]
MQVRVPWTQAWLCTKDFRRKCTGAGVAAKVAVPSNAAQRELFIIMNPVYSPGSSGVPYASAKGLGYPAGFPMGYAAAAPAYSTNMYAGASPAFQTGYTPGAPYKVSCSPTSGAVPPYSSSPNPYQTAVYPVRSAYPQQNPYTQQSAYYTQPVYAAPPHRKRNDYGNGSWDHNGDVCRYFIDDSFSFPSSPPSSHNAYISGSRNTNLQLCAPAVVIVCRV